MISNKIVVVIHSNYSEGTDAYAFWDEKTAEESVNTDVELVAKDLTDQGHKPTILRRPSGATVYVPDSNIYYEWEILKTTIEGEMPTLEDRDKELKQFWEEFADIPMNPETECIEESFLGFPAGTNREEIWRWFDERYSKGVAYLLYNGVETYVPETRRLYGLKRFCTECDSECCVFNPDGVCLAPYITGRAPALSENGCKDFCYKEEIQE